MFKNATKTLHELQFQLYEHHKAIDAVKASSFLHIPGFKYQPKVNRQCAETVQCGVPILQSKKPSSCTVLRAMPQIERFANFVGAFVETLDMCGELYIFSCESYGLTYSQQQSNEEVGNGKDCYIMLC